MNTKSSAILFQLVLTVFIFLANAQGSIGQAPAGAQAGKPVETKSANTDYKPAFAGQTRIKSVATKTPYSVTKLTDQLDLPWGIAYMPDGRLLVTEKEGNMRIVSQKGIVGGEITGIPSVNDGGQGGLLGLCLDPNFTNNRMVYWVFSENVPGGTLTAVAKGRLSKDEKTIEGAKVIFRAGPAADSKLHYGGRILFDSKGNLIVSTGERSNKSTRPLAQSVKGALGKIVRITTEGKPASGNPKFSEVGAIPELYSIGHRNVQGIAIHPSTGDLWETEFGPRGGDEINLIKPGKNYGWPTITYGIEYGGSAIGEPIQQKAGLEQPVYYYDPVISPSGITFYKGSRIPEWENNLFVSALSGMHIARLVIQDNRVVGEERLCVNEKQRFRDITQGKDGALYAITDGGNLYRIDKK